MLKDEVFHAAVEFTKANLKGCSTWVEPEQADAFMNKIFDSLLSNEKFESITWQPKD